MLRWRCVLLLFAAGCGGGQIPAIAGSGGTDGAPITIDAPSSADGAATDAAMESPAAPGGPPSTPPVCPPPPSTPRACTPPADKRCPPPHLGQTGCMDATNPQKLAASVIPYEVNSPLWSDGALKTRGIALPPGQHIHVKNCAANTAECCVVDPNNFPMCLPAHDDGKWVFPIGTVMIKNFMFPDADQSSGMKFVETRLFVRLPDQPDATGKPAEAWVGYGYQWNAQQTDATIVSDAVNDARSSATFTIGTAGGRQSVVWHYPSRADCMQCHARITPSGGFVLGAETAQMNRVVGGQNQLDRLQAMGLFDAPLPRPYKAALVAPYAGQTGAPPAGATVEQRARSYLHANCAFCHRPDGDFYFMDFRYDASLKEMAVCNVAPGKGDLGVMDAQRLVPAAPMKSVLSLRMTAPAATDASGNTGRMPQIGSYVVDSQGAKLVGDWITSIKACPD
ncbi:MAG TPA: hypothetical protein VNO55_22585 [Polyangia bacterium]|nr:hypothetical protein [Polyangia bacterium]